MLLNFILIDNYALTCKPDPYPFVLGINTQSLLLGYKLGQYLAQQCNNVNLISDIKFTCIGVFIYLCSSSHGFEHSSYCL